MITLTARATQFWQSKHRYSLLKLLPLILSWDSSGWIVVSIHSSHVIFLVSKRKSAVKILDRFCLPFDCLERWLMEFEVYEWIIYASHKFWRSVLFCARNSCLLLENYLHREDFHFTPYSTISYLLPGPRASLLSKSDAKVRLPEPSTEASSNSLRLSFTEFCDAFSEVRGKAQACGVKRSMSACLMSSGAKKSKDDSDSIDLTVECRDEASPILVKDSDDAFEWDANIWL